MTTEVFQTAIIQPSTIRDQPGMQNEWNRLATFADVNVPEGIFVIPLANNGFHVSNVSQGKSAEERLVECAFCSVVVPMGLFVHVKPTEVHTKVSPRCSVVLGQRTGDRSIADAAQKTGTAFTNRLTQALPVSFQPTMLATPTPDRDSAVSASSGVDTSSNTSAAAAAGGDRGQGGETAGRAGTSGNSQERQTITYEDLNIITERPRRPDMAVTQTRINTFNGWPHQTTHPKKEMAEAGFYHTGHEDLVRCFHCKGGLKTWESSDKPWVEHARWFPRCAFVKLCKGQRFIDAVQSLNDPNTRPTISLEAVEREMRRIGEEEERQRRVSVSNLSVHSTIYHQTAQMARPDIRLKKMVQDSGQDCSHCQKSPREVKWLPCGHVCICRVCFFCYERQGDNYPLTCEVCGNTIDGVRCHGLKAIAYRLFRSPLTARCTCVKYNKP